MASAGSFMKYVKAAFLWHWNLLAVGAGTALAVLSGRPDVILPLLAAAEIGYLGLLSTHPRFRKAVDVRPDKSESINHTALLNQIQAVLKPDAWARFEQLRERCLNLDRLARQFRGPQPVDASPASELQTASLERLLWMFLKLLYSLDALSRFLRGTNRSELLKQLEAGEKQLETVKANPRSEKFVRSLEDKLQTLRQRLANYDHAVENREFLAVELDRIEQKVNAISEMAINARDASDISAQVDGIAEGISATEEAMRTLDVAPVLQREQPPPLLTQRL